MRAHDVAAWRMSWIYPSLALNERIRLSHLRRAMRALDVAAWMMSWIYPSLSLNERIRLSHLRRAMRAHGCITMAAEGGEVAPEVITARRRWGE